MFSIFDYNRAIFSNLVIKFKLVLFEQGSDVEFLGWKFAKFQFTSLIAWPSLSIFASWKRKENIVEWTFVFFVNNWDFNFGKPLRFEIVWVLYRFKQEIFFSSFNCITLFIVHWSEHKATIFVGHDTSKCWVLELNLDSGIFNRWVNLTLNENSITHSEVSWSNAGGTYGAATYLGWLEYQ